jgi:hypothetical protein
MHFDIQRGATCTLAVALPLTALSTSTAAERELDFRELRAIDSGHQAYYELRRDERGPYLHAAFRPGDDAVKQALVLREAERAGRHRLAWRWRALVLPSGGNECDPRRTDSAGSVYVAWRRGLRWYGLKYAWSSVGPLGAVCDRRDNPLMRGETIIQRTGGPLGAWVDESLDLEAEFRKHFADGNPHAEVPDLIGIAVLTDGDETHSASSADFGSFVLRQDPS